MKEKTDIQVPGYGACFASFGLGLAPIFLILGIAGVFGSNTVTWNGRNVYGFAAIIVAIVLNVVFAAIFAGLQKLGFVILGLIRRPRSEAEA